MTEELRPISYHGMGNMMHSLFGYSPADYSGLREQPVRSVEVSEDKTRLTFTLMDGRTLTYEAEGDCCSYSWIEHLTVPPDIEGAIFTEYAEREMGETEQDYEYIRVYQTAFRCTKGEVIIEYRNSSNGYYGGWLKGPVD